MVPGWSLVYTALRRGIVTARGRMRVSLSENFSALESARSRVSLNLSWSRGTSTAVTGISNHTPPPPKTDRLEPQPHQKP